MNCIVLDFEWNQPLSPKDTLTDPFFFDSEIIQIGAVRLDDNFTAVSEFSTYIRPHFYPHMNGAVVSLTKIRPQDLERAPLFPQAFADFIDWCGDDCVLCSWGPDDIPVLLDNMLLHDIPTDPFPCCVDLQRIFAREILRENRQCSLEDAVKMLNLPADRAHDALNDTRNTVRICDRMDLAGCIEEYLYSFVNYGAGRLSGLVEGRLYPDVNTALTDDAVTSLTCPYCGNQVSLSYCRQNGNTLLGYGQCEDGDEFFARFQHFRKGNDGCRCKRMAYGMSDDFWDIYQQAADAAR